MIISRIVLPEAIRWATIVSAGRRVGVRARNALRHAGGYLKNMIEAIASMKPRRMERELDLRAIRVDRSSSDRMVRESPPAERS